MFDNLNVLAYGLVSFAILIGVGSIVLINFGGSVASCAEAGQVYNSTLELCANSTDTATPVGTSYTTVKYLANYLGTQSGGLANWTPAIIAISVGFLFLSFFGFGRKKKR